MPPTAPSRTLVRRLAAGAAVVVAGLASGACGGGADGPIVDEVRVASYEMAFDPEELIVPVGRVAFTLVNEGAVPHTFVIEARGFKLKAFETGAESTAVANLPEGAYFFYCDIEGHRDLGMEGALYVGDERPLPDQAGGGDEAADQAR